MPESPEDLSHLRKQIDATDQEIIRLLCQRFSLAKEIGSKKELEGSPVYRPDREREIYRNLAEFLSERQDVGIPLRVLENIYREIMSASISMEKELIVAYLGPAASFSHVALQSRFGNTVQSCPEDSIGQVFRTVAMERKANYGIVPVDNTTEGSIGITLDHLAHSDLKIYAEHYIPVRHFLLFHKQKDPRKVRCLYSIGIAYQQCREWVQRHLDHDIEYVEMPSTAAAAKQAAQRKDGAAIASQLAAQTYDLEIIASNIQDNSNNITRFLVIGYQQCQPTQDDKTSIIFSLLDQPGSLVSILSLFANANINLTKIESRSNRRNFGEYNFFVDFLGHKKDKPIVEILKQVKDRSSFLRILGSYPRMKYPA